MSNNRNLSQEKKSYFESRIDSSGKKLDCSEQKLKFEDMKNLVIFLQAKPNIEELDLNYNKLGKDAIESVKEIILQNKSIKKISLLYNKIGDEGLLSLIKDEKIKNQLSEIYLELACNEISKKLIKQARLLLSPESMLSIISGNPIWDAELIEECRSSASDAITKKKNHNIPVNSANKETDNISSQISESFFSAKKQKCELPHKVKMLITEATNEIGSDPDMWSAFDQYLNEIKFRQITPTSQYTK